MKEFIDLLNQNIEYIVGIPAISAAFALVARWAVTKLTTIIIPWMERIMTTLMLQFFGENADGDVSELHIVKDVQNIIKMNIKIAEMELVRLKKETINPIYTEAERLTLKAMFNDIYKVYENLISEETKLVIEMLNNA
jgi:hypothetical protein